MTTKTNQASLAPVFFENSSFILKRIEEKSEKKKEEFKTEKCLIQKSTDYMAENTVVIHLNVKMTNLTEEEAEKILVFLEPLIT